MSRITLKEIRAAFIILCILSVTLQSLLSLDGIFRSDVDLYVQRLRPAAKQQASHPTGSLVNASGLPFRTSSQETRSSHGLKRIGHIASSSQVPASNDPLPASDSANPLHSPNLYWNLSCPIEQSMFSGAHMDGDYLQRATKARILSKEALSIFADMDWKALEDRTIYFVGDSLMRQLFISVACLSWDRVTNYAIPWFEKRPVRTRQPNTIGNGPHSKFEEGRIQLKGNTELVFHHGTGGLIELGEEYQSHDPDTWIKACYTKQPLTTTIPIYPRSDHARKLLSTLNVNREHRELKHSDIVLINASVHGGRDYNLHNIVDLLKCKSVMKYPNDMWPTMMYIATGPSHFPTDTGAFSKELLENDDDYSCRQETSFHGYQEEEAKLVKDYLPLLGRDLLPLQYHSGDLHVGGKDCLHWLQPGIPDIIAANITSTLTKVTS